MKDKIVIGALMLLVGIAIGQALGILPALAANPDPMISTFDLVPFRGRIEKDGLPFSDPVKLTFKLYATQNAADPFYQEIIDPVRPADGNFAVVLGVSGKDKDGASLKLSAALRGNDLVYVGITVDNGIELTGRQRLASTPYATRVNTILAADIGNGEVGTQHLSTAGCADGQFHVLNGSTWSCQRRVPRLDVGPSPPPSPGPSAIEIAGPSSGIRMSDRGTGSANSTWSVLPDDAKLIISNTYNGIEALLTLDARDNSVRLGNVYNGSAEAAPSIGTKLYFSGARDVSNTYDSDNSDPVWIARVSGGDNFADLRVNIGNDSGFGDRFIIGRTNVMDPANPNDDVFVANFAFDNEGNAFRPGGGSWLNISDERLKNINGRFERGLKELMQLRAIRFRYKPGNAMNAPTDREHVGFSAQAVERVVPEAISFNKEGYRTVNNDPILWTMLNAIQEQQREIESLRARLERLEARGPRSASRR